MIVKKGSISQAVMTKIWKPELAAIVNASAFVLCLVCLLAPLNSQAQNTISTYAGGAPPVDDLPGPTSAVRDAAGNTYIAAPYSTYVFKLSGGTITTFAGTGIEGFGGDGGPAGTATLGLPNGLTIDSKGNIYIVDFKTSRVRMVDTSGNITTVAGSGTKCEPSTGTCGDGGPALKAAFNFPLAVGVNSAGNLYIADAFDNRIRAVNRGTKSATLFGVTIPAGDIATIAGNGIPCANPTSSCGDGGTPLGPTLNYPQSVALDSAGNLYIGDTRDNKIRMINATGTPVITTVAGTGGICNSISKCGDGGAAISAELHMPMWVFLDASNNVYIADTNSHKIRLVSALTGTISTVAGTGVEGFAGDGGVATSAELNFPGSVFLDSSGNLVIADSGNQRVRQVSAGIISSIAGGGMGGDGGPATSATLANPFSVAEDAAGNLYIADTANNRIRLVNTQTPPMISTVAGTGIVGSTGDGGPAASATLNGPTGVKVDSLGNLWIADAGNNVVRKVDASTQTITTYAGTLGKSCFRNDSCGDLGPATLATLSTPRSVALDTAGNLFIADYTAHRVRRVDATTQIITTLAGTGIAGRKCGNGAATNANLNHPSDVAVDGAGNVYIDDSYSNMICQVLKSDGSIADWALNGAYKFGGDGGPAINASQWNPLAVAIDPAGNLFIGGGNYDCVRRVDVTPAIPTIGTVAGDVGQHCVGGFAGDGGLATTAKISAVGLFVDGQSNLYLADGGNNRVRTVHLTPAVTIKPPANFGAWPLHTTSTPQTFSITSSGGVDLSLTGTSLGGNNPGDFTETGTTCGSPALLGVDVSCSFTFTFTPLNYGKRTATFILTDNASNSPQAVVLSGFGPYFTVMASPTTLSINPGSEGDSTLTIAPFGGFNQTVNLTSSGCPPASTCSITPTSVTLDGTNSQTALLRIVTTTTTPPGSYKVVATGEFGGGNQLQWSATVTVNIP
jgi:hypothetical protein